MPLSQEKKTKPIKKATDGDLPSTQEEWVRYVNSAHTDGLLRKKKYELQWALNMAYVLGYQHLIFNRKTGSIEIPTNLSSPLTINRIGSFVEARHSKLTKNRPAPRVIPNTYDKDDMNAAKFGEDILMHLWRSLEMEDEYDALVIQMLIFGTSFIQNIWNPLDGDYIADYKESSPGSGIIDVNEDGEMEEEKVFLGDVSSRCISPFQIIPANDQTLKLKDQEWVLHRNFLSVSDADKFYPHLAGKLQKQADHDLRTDSEKVIERLASPLSSMVGIARTFSSDSINSTVLQKTMWIRPNVQYPQGIVVSVVGDQLAYLGKFPNNYGKQIYPFVKFAEKNDGVHFWQQSTIERLMSIQRAYNRLRQKKLNNVYLMANGKWMVPKGAQLAEDAITDEENEVIEYNSAVPEPHQAQIQSLPNYARELAQELITDFRDVCGQRESSITPPTNLTAGVAMQIAAELSDEIISPIIRRLSSSMSKVGNQQLLLVDQEYEDGRLIKIIGEGDKFGARWFKSADLRNHTDVHIEIDSMFPDFRGAKRQTLLDLWDRRVITDPNALLKSFRYGSFDVLLEDAEKEDDPVWLEIEAIKNGKQPEITQFQNHANYVRILSRWLETPEFLRLEPDRKQIAVATLQTHLSFLTQSLPLGGAAMPQQNQNAVGTPFGPQVPVGA